MVAGNKQFFIYSAFFINNGIYPREQDIVIDTDSDFEIHGITGYYDAYSAGAPLPSAQTASSYNLPDIFLSVLNLSTGRALSNAPFALPVVAGSGEQMFKLLFPVLWIARSKISITAVQDALEIGGITLNFRVNFIGAKVYGN